VRRGEGGYQAQPGEGAEGDQLFFPLIFPAGSRGDFGVRLTVTDRIGQEATWSLNHFENADNVLRRFHPQVRPHIAGLRSAPRVFRVRFGTDGRPVTPPPEERARRELARYHAALDDLAKQKGVAPGSMITRLERRLNQLGRTQPIPR
jgi:hypothetical protein